MDHPPSFPARKCAALGAVAGLLLFSACSGGSRRFSGRVIDEQGQPIRNASVEVSGARTTTSATGEFQVSPAAQERYLLNIGHPDYADLSFASRVPLVSKTWRLIRAQTSTVDATTAITITDTRPELTTKGLAGATLTLSPNSLVDDRGTPRRGPFEQRSPRSTSQTGRGLPTGLCAPTTAARKAISSHMVRCTFSSPIPAAG